jgi:CHASE3 domain sensor protein
VPPINAKTLRLLAWSIGVTALLAVILSAAIVRLVEREHTETDLVRHSRAVNSQISEVSLFVQRMETNQRGYLLTGRDLYLVHRFHGSNHITWPGRACRTRCERSVPD